MNVEPKDRLFAAAEARDVAERIVRDLGDTFDRVAVAGSLRRGKLKVHDVDLVVISKKVDVPAAAPSLFNQTEKTWAVAVRLGELASVGVIEMVVCGNSTARFIHSETGVPVDVYFATPENWTLKMLIRTGSKAHNIRMCKAAQSKGWKLYADGSGLEKFNGEMVQFAGEADIFEALGQMYRRPEWR